MKTKSVVLFWTWLSIVSITNSCCGCGRLISTRAAFVSHDHVFFETRAKRYGLRQQEQQQRQLLQFHSVSKKASSSSSSSLQQQNIKSKISKKKQQQQHVLYQKILRPSSSSSSSSSKKNDLEFLGSLVTFLQDEWELPERLPMTYEKIIPESNGQGGGDSVSLMMWSSPLSPNPLATTCHVQVVAIYPNHTTTTTTTTTTSDNTIMALLAITKAVDSIQMSKLLPPMLYNLFLQSEKMLIQSLDRSLQDFSNSHHFLSQQSYVNNNNKNSHFVPTEFQKEDEEEEEQNDYLLRETAGSSSDSTLEQIILSKNNNNSKPKKNVGAKNVVLDAEIVVNSHAINSPGTRQLDDDDDDVTRKPMKLPKEEEQQPPPMDFAVQQAQRIAQQRQQEGFAVTAARRMAQQKYTNNNNKTSSNLLDEKNSLNKASLQSSNKNKYKNTNPKTDNPKDLQLSSSSSSSSSWNKSFYQSISSLQDSQKNNNKDTENKKLEAQKLLKQSEEFSAVKKFIQQKFAAAKVKKETAKRETNNDNLNITNLDATRLVEEDTRKEKKPTRNKVLINDNSRLLDGKNQNINQNLWNPPINDDDNKENNPLQSFIGQPPYPEDDDEAIRSVRDALDEMVQESTDMTPEQLLENVMKFGDAKQKEEQFGNGFAMGAFEKAKELLKERHHQRLEAESTKQLKTETGQTKWMNHENENYEQNNNLIRPFTAEEELRQMFEAGERLADRKITNSWNDNTDQNRNRNTLVEDDADAKKELDAIIATGEKDVSSYARLLEDELVELELRINKSPGQELDPPAKMNQNRPAWDIFSGPEVYNPNIDSSITWDDGQEKQDSKKFLPKELREALTQAQFASQVLGKLEERKQENGTTQYFAGNREITPQQVQSLRKVVSEAVSIGLIPDPLMLLAERSRLQLLIDELWNQPEERIREVVLNYKDLLLSDNFVNLVRERLEEMAQRDLMGNDWEIRHTREREILGSLVSFAQLLLREARALGAELEAQQLEIIRSICKVAMDPSHTTEEETAMALTDAVRDMRPLLDDAFVAYLKYAIPEEKARLARAGVLDDPEHNQWLFVLQIVQNGVYTELARGIHRYIDHIGYVLRMETPSERRLLLEKLIDVMPSLDVRPFVAVVDSIAGSLGEVAQGIDNDDDYSLAGQCNRIWQLHRDVQELLPPERIAKLARDADEWAAAKKRSLRKQRQETLQRMEAARQTEDLDDVVAQPARGEVERFDFT